MAKVLLVLAVTTLVLLGGCGGGGSAPVQSGGPEFTSITGLTDGAELSGLVHVSASAAGGKAVTEVSMHVNGARAFHHLGHSLSYFWNTDGVINGACAVTLKAVDAGGREVSRSFDVTVANEVPEPPPVVPSPGPDSPPAPDPVFPPIDPLPDPNDPDGEPVPVEAPVVTIEMPDTPPGPDYDPTDTEPPTSVVLMGIEDNDVVYGVWTFSLLATDDRGVGDVYFIVDGTEYAHAPGPTLSVSWDTTVLPQGPVQLAVVCRDRGYSWAAYTFLVTVDNINDHVKPVIDRTNSLVDGLPFENSTYLPYPVNIDLKASDNVGVVRMEFFVDGVLIKSADAETLKFNWDIRSLNQGIVKAEVRAWDSAGNMGNAFKVFHLSHHGPITTISGVIRAPNGKDPLPFARLELLDREYGHEMQLGHIKAYADGYLRFVGAPQGEHTARVKYGWLEWEFPVTLTDSEYVLTAEQSIMPPAVCESLGSDIAVVTGSAEHVEDMLARFGLGEVDSSGRLRRGTEKFTLIDGDNSLAAALDFMSLVRNMDELWKYSFIFVCSGNAYEGEFRVDTQAHENVRRWLSGSYMGNLYCGGSAYDIGETINPQRVWFAPGDPVYDNSSEPETLNAAQCGEPLPTFFAFPTHWYGERDASALSWLAAVGMEGQLESFPCPLAAGWTKITDIGYSDVVFAGSTQPGFSWSVEPLIFSSQMSSGNVYFSAVPACSTAAPHPQLPERMLEYAFLEMFRMEFWDY